MFGSQQEGLNIPTLDSQGVDIRWLDHAGTKSGRISFNIYIYN